jgi:uncharacterized protein (TIGR03437 family)
VILFYYYILCVSRGNLEVRDVLDERATTGQLVSTQSPAPAGDVLSMYVSGLAPGGLIPPQVTVGGQPAEIEFLGMPPAIQVIAK